MLHPKQVIAALCVASVALVAAPSALAGTATYNSTGPLFVPDGVVRTSTISIPSGRTAIESVDVSNFTIQWPASGQDLSTQLISPDGTFLNLFTEGCFSYQAADVWTFSDSGTETAPNAKEDPNCDLPGGTFRPADLVKKLSIFAGKPAAGTWTLQAVDKGLINNPGSIVSWALRIVHAPPTLSASGPGSGKLGDNLALTATSNANGTVATSGDVQPGNTAMGANVATPVPFDVNQNARNQIAKTGRTTVNINLAFTDETGGTAASSVSVVVTGKKKKCKKGRKLKRGKCVKKKKKK